MKITELTRDEVRHITKAGSGRRCDCWLTKPDTCERCLARTLRNLIRRTA